MLQLKGTNVYACEEVARERFQEEVICQAKIYAKHLYDINGEGVFREVIKTSIADAMKYGLTKRGPVALYTDFSFYFGVGFVTDPQLNWVQQVLLDDSYSSELERADFLYFKMTQFIERVYGDENQYLIKSIKCSEQLSLIDVLSSYLTTPDRTWLTKFWCTKATTIDDKIWSELVNKANQNCDKYNIKREDGEAVIVLFMFIFGHEVFSDPLYPWVVKTLKESEDGKLRISKLYSKLGCYIQAVYKNFKRVDKCRY